jgi:hypothetical protein
MPMPRPERYSRRYHVPSLSTNANVAQRGSLMRMAFVDLLKDYLPKGYSATADASFGIRELCN